MTIIQSLLLGLIQGLTEFLPISSSAHLVLAQTVFGLSPDGEADLLFNILVHIGTLAAVCVAFRKLLLRLFADGIRMLQQIFTGKFHWKKASSGKRMIVFLIVSLLPLLVVYPLRELLEPIMSSVLCVGIALIFNAGILLISDFAPEGKKTPADMRFSDAIFVGAIQAAAVIPGISRSGSTITAGISCRLKRSFAAKYSFILSIPTILAAAVLEIVDAVQVGIHVSAIPVYLVGMLAAAVSGFFAIKLLQYLLKSKKFVIFAAYSLIVGVGAILWSFFH